MHTRLTKDQNLDWGLICQLPYIGTRSILLRKDAPQSVKLGVGGNDLRHSPRAEIEPAGNLGWVFAAP